MIKSNLFIFKCYKLGTVSGVGDLVVNQRDKISAPMEFRVQWEKHTAQIITWSKLYEGTEWES